MPGPKTRTFRPSLDGLEARRLLSATVHADGVVDLKATPIRVELLKAVTYSTPSPTRQRIVVEKLSADPATNTVSGAVVEVYKVKLVGSLSVYVKFTTDLDNPRPKDVKVKLSKFDGFLSSSGKAKVANNVVAFVQKDHDAIEAAIREM